MQHLPNPRDGTEFAVLLLQKLRLKRDQAQAVLTEAATRSAVADAKGDLGHVDATYCLNLPRVQ